MDPIEYVFGSVVVPCFIAMESHNWQVWYSFMGLLFLQFAVLFVSMLRIISIPRFRWEFMKTCKLVIVM